MTINRNVQIKENYANMLENVVKYMTSLETLN